MTDQTVIKFLHVHECFGTASYSLWDHALPDDDCDGYKCLGEIEVPAVSEEMLRGLALDGVNKEIAEASLVLKALNEKKQQLLAISHDSGKI